MERSNLFNHLLRIFDEGLSMKTTELEFGTLEVTVENRSQDKKITFFAKGMEEAKQKATDLRLLLRTLREMTEINELTPTIVNSLIERIEVHNNDKSSGHCYVKVDIYFTAIGLIDIPTEDEIKSLMAKIKANPQEYRLTA